MKKSLTGKMHGPFLEVNCLDCMFVLNNKTRNKLFDKKKINFTLTIFWK